MTTTHPSDDVTVSVAENIADTVTITDLSDTSADDTNMRMAVLSPIPSPLATQTVNEIDLTLASISLASGKSLHETRYQHVLTVSANEADGSGSDTATVTINVTDIDDNNSSVDDVTVSVAENIADAPSPSLTKTMMPLVMTPMPMACLSIHHRWQHRRSL